MRRTESRSVAFFYSLVFLASQTGIAAIMEVTLDSPLSGFILKPEKESLSNLFSREKEYLIAPVMQTSLLTSVRVEFGDYVSEQRVSQSSLKKALGANQIPTNALLGDHEISAHVVRQSISPDSPLVQVLFHASIIPPAAYRSEKISENWSGSESSLNFRNDSKYCLIAYVLKEMLHLSSFCALNERTKVCLAEIRIPSEWWAVDEAVNVNVFYSAALSDYNVNCTEAFNQTERVDSDKNFVSVVSLANSPLTYEELKEDSNILVYIPQSSFYPGSTFRMPVKLHSDSNLETFIMKVKARHGVRVIGAEARNSTVWRITLDLNHKLHGAMVTASAVNKGLYNRAVTDVFEWIFEVDEDAYGDDRGRINILLEYEKMMNQKDFSQPVENRLVARVEIQRDNIFAIVPVVKMRELVNLAVLTGKMQNYNIRIYSVTHSGRIADVTSQSTCHSSDDTIIKVVESCNWIYLDGTEVRGSSAASIIAKFGRHTKFLLFKVWLPEFPLDVELSDNELGLIRGWKVPPESHRLSRTARGTDYGSSSSLTNSGGQGQQDKTTGRKDVSMAIACDARYQLSMLEVFASFISTSGLNKQYLIKHEAKFRLTDLLLSQIRVTDPTVISLKGNIVEGLKPGLSEIQVVSSSGKVVGTKDIVVSNDKVSIEKLQVDLTVGLSLVVDADLDVPGALLARVSRHDQLKRKDKDALLDISLKFDDGAVVPLQYFQPKDYILDFDDIDSQVIGFGAAFSPAMPRVIAHGQGKGKVLKVSLELADVCQRKASRPLAVGYAHADIDFMKPLTELERLQNDAEQYKFSGNRQGTVRGITGQTQIPTNIKQTVHVSYDDSLNAEYELGNRVENSAATDRNSGSQKTSQQKEVQQKHISYGQKLTSLEIGMYVLLGVFCFAVIIFGINCTIFVIRYRRKKSPSGDYKDTVNCAPDWVWISRDMLERNDINTSCSQALMPDADFHVSNHSPSGAASSSATASERNTCMSNRNSFVSTYRGSECSVQIAVASAISDCSAGAVNDRNGRHSGSLKQNIYPGTPSRPTPQQIRQYMEEMEMSKELHKGRKKSTAITREERLRHIEEGAASGSDFEWDYEVLGVTYEELMEYFDNLKESTA